MTSSGTPADVLPDASDAPEGTPDPDAATASPVVVRRARTGDRPAVRELVRVLAGDDRTLTTFDRTYGTLVAALDTFLGVAEDADGQVVGYVLAAHHLTFTRDGAVVWVEELCVDPDARRGGVGTALVAAVDRWAAAVGVRRLTLATRRAGDFYRAVGFEGSAVYYGRDVLTPAPAAGPADPADGDAASAEAADGEGWQPVVAPA